MPLRKKLGKFVESTIQAIQTTHYEKPSKRDVGCKVKREYDTDLMKCAGGGTCSHDHWTNASENVGLLDAFENNTSQTFSKTTKEQNGAYPKTSRKNLMKTTAGSGHKIADDSKSDRTPLLHTSKESLKYNTIPKSVKRQTNDDERTEYGRFSLALGNVTTSDYESGDIKLFAAEDEGPPFRLEDDDPATPQYRSLETVDTQEHSKSAPEISALGSNDGETGDPKSICVFSGNVKQSIIHLGNNGEAKGGASITVGSSEQNDLRRRVEEQTITALASLPEEWVQTEGYTAAEKMIGQRPLQMTIITGDGDGTTFTALAMLREMTKYGEAKPYKLISPKEWTCVDTSEKAVIFLPDITGTTHLDDTKAEKFITMIEQRILPYAGKTGNITFIVTMKKFQSECSYIATNYRDYVIDLQSKTHRISNETKRKLAINFMKKYNVKVCQYKVDETIAKQRENQGQFVLMSKDTLDDIIYLSETNGFVRKLNMYFTLHLSEGADYFIKPRQDLVQAIRQLPKQKMLALVGVNAEEGELSKSRIDQLRDIGRSLHNVHENSRHIFKQHVDTRKNAILFRYARMHGMMSKLADILEQCCQKLDGTLLQENGDVFRFSGAAVENSFLIVLSEELPTEVLSTCSIDFLHKYVGVFQAFSDEEDGLYVKLTPTERNRLRTVMIRMKEEIFLKEVKKVCHHSLMRESWFAENFLTFLKQEKRKNGQWLKDKRLIRPALTELDACTQDPYCMLYFGVEVMFRYPGTGKPVNLCEMILKEGTWLNEIRKKKKWRQWAEAQGHETLRHATELSRETTVNELVLIGALITVDTLLVAIRTGNAQIVTTILEHGKFRHNEWCSAVYCALKTNQQSAKGMFESVATSALQHFEGSAIQKMMLWAAENNDTQMFHQLLVAMEKDERLNIDINVMSHDNDTPLVIAVRKSYIDFVQQLLWAGADQMKNGIKELPIHIVVKTGCAPILNALLNNKPSVISEKDRDGFQPLHLAVKHGNEDCVDVLLQREAEIDATDNKMQTPLHMAVEGGHASLVDKLIKNKAVTHLADERKDTPLSPFGLACRLGKINCVEAFLQSNSHLRDNVGLIQAVIAGNENIVELLLAYGYDVNQTDDSPLLAAIRNDNYEMATLLIKKGANIMASHKGIFLLHETCTRGDTKMVDLLLSYGANITTKQPPDGNNVIHTAVLNNKPDMIRHIFAREDSAFLVDMKNDKLETALHFACMAASVDMVEILLKQGFSKDSTTWTSGAPETPLTIAKHLERKSRANKSACRKIIKLLCESV